MSVTIKEIYAAINPLPATLSAKGKKRPEVEFCIEANARLSICLKWVKPQSNNDWDREYKTFLGERFDVVLAEAVSFIEELPSAEQAKLHDFMGQLGKLIDNGKLVGIEVEFMNPLVATMKRLSENIITYQPKRRRASRTPQDTITPEVDHG